MNLNVLEQAVLEKLLPGEHPALVILRQQLAVVEAIKREFTGVGFYTDLRAPDDVAALGGDAELGDVNATIDGLSNGAGFVLFIRKGRLSMLEGYTYDEPWPNPVGVCALSYRDPERSSELRMLDGIG